MKMIIATIALVIAINFTSTTIIHAQDADRQKAAIALIKESGMIDATDQIISAVMTQVTQSLKQKNPNISDETISLIVKSAIKGFHEQKPIFMVEAAKIYTRYFTADEMRAITAFYQTPAGKKSIKVLPQLTVEGMQLGQKWAQAALPGVLADIKKHAQEKGLKL